jgi:predicted DNA binding CopG/RHH family protein
MLYSASPAFLEKVYCFFRYPLGSKPQSLTRLKQCYADLEKEELIRELQFAFREKQASVVFELSSSKVLNVQNHAPANGTFP